MRSVCLRLRLPSDRSHLGPVAVTIAPFRLAFAPVGSAYGSFGQSPSGSLRFPVLFHSLNRVLPSRYYFAIGHPGVFSLARWSLLIHTGFHVPLGSERKLVMLSTTGLSPSRVQHSTASPSSTTLVLLSHNPVFTFARLSLACPWIQQQFERLTYSGISGSMLIFNSPKHLVAYYALPRLWVPRYPP
ncbi:hypothetical protein E3N88_32867 [Mikania micrantha]|uniref:Uncharacterized protein n=1 Tax=Mikania micrantha TaxID=192012 RepID=A0A5N6MA61_9ASTR|nr:hypothetical protein E3N88_32867 [Mikania micrantha]